MLTIVTNTAVFKANAFATAIHFYASLIFARKAGAALVEAFKDSTLKDSILALQSTTLKRAAYVNPT